MTRDAKLYYLNNRDYSFIKETIEFDTNAPFLSERIAIFNHTSSPMDNHYLLLSIDDRIDRIIEENGGIEAATNDLYKKIIKENKHKGDFIFGNEELIYFLPI